MIHSDVRRRHDDVGKVAASLNVLVSRYRGLVTVIGVLFAGIAWFGAVYVGPGKRMDMLEARVLANRALQDSMFSTVAQMQQMLKIMTLDICLRRANDPYVFMQMGCANYNIKSR